MYQDRSAMPWARRLVVAATVFGLLSTPVTSLAQEDAEPTTSTEASDATTDAPVEAAPAENLGTAETFVDAFLDTAEPETTPPATEPESTDSAEQSAADTTDTATTEADEETTDDASAEDAAAADASTAEEEPVADDSGYQREPIGRGNGNGGNGGNDEARQSTGNGGGEEDVTGLLIDSFIGDTITGGTDAIAGHTAPAGGGVVDVAAKSAAQTEGIVIDGGDVDNSTTINGDAGGGDAGAAANGGDDNAAVVTGTDNGGSGSGSRIGPNGNRRKRPDLVWMARNGGSRSGSGLGVAERAIAAVGNGGFASANANGGTIMMGPVFSGNNRGNTIIVQAPDGSPGCIDGPIVIDGGDVNNSTTINLDASGGTAIAEANGGSGNTGVVDGSGNGGVTGSVGNGGDARANANGGTIMMGPIFSGGNEGNTIIVEGGYCGGGNAGGGGKSGGGGKAANVTAMPETGSGPAHDLQQELAMLSGIVAAAVLSAAALRYRRT